jgi:hypothetical protein
MHSTVQRILSRNLLDRDKNRRAIGRQGLANAAWCYESAIELATI